MGSAHAGKAVLAAIGLGVLLHLGGAHECNVTQVGHETTYNIPDLDYIGECMFTWSNASAIVLATHANKTEPVTMSRFGKLVSSKCIGNMTFSGTCVTETPKDYWASCSVTCLPETGKRTGDEGMSPSLIGGIVAAVIVAAVIVLLGCLVCFLCYKYNLWSTRRGQTGGLYSAVMFQKNPNADVERGGGGG